MTRVDSIEAYIAAHAEWRGALQTLVGLAREAGLDEGIKWGAPAFMLDGSNVVGVLAFSRHVALWFHQGALLDDPLGVLINAQPGKTRAQRQWRFGADEPIDADAVRAYLQAAASVARDGRRIAAVPADMAVAAELVEALGDGRLRRSFEALTPGRQREYHAWIAEARRADTRQRRLQQARELILAGQGLNDRYR